jgi:hypothetical protein
MQIANRTLKKSFIPVLIGCLLAVSTSNCKKEEEPVAEPIPVIDFGPSRELQIAVQNLIVLGFLPAPKAEHTEYPYHSHLITIENQPFFIVDAKQHWFLGRNENYDSTLAHGTLGKVKNAWAYFIRSEAAGDMVPDAIIEEWQFETQKEAYDAFKEMGGLINCPTIKEPSYSLQHDDRFYLLYTRAHAFQQELDKIYEMLKSNL